MKALVLVSTLGGLILAAQPAWSAAAPSVAAVSPWVVTLDYVEGKEVLANRRCSFTSRSKPFRKEPDTTSSGVIRGQLQLGNGATNAFPCLLDHTNGKLYLDLNHNGDLTDDPAGVFTASTNDTVPVLNGAVVKVFTDVRVALQTASGLHSCLLDLNFHTYGRRTVASVVANSRSYWRGKANWQGLDWEAALFEDLQEGRGSSQGPFLWFRPWDERTRPVNLLNGSADIIHFPTRLFWQNQAYAVSRRFEKVGETERCRLELKPEQPALGELKVEGSLLHRIILEDSRGYTLFLDNFDRPLKVPVGHYKISAVWIRKDGADALQDTGRTIAIVRDSPTALRLGGPLTNSVAVNRRGKYLTLSYKLIGADGGTYRLMHEEQRTPPQFAIYRGDQKVAGGQFQFG